MYNEADLTAAFVLQGRFMDSESEDSVLDLNYSDLNPDLIVFISAPTSRSRPKCKSRSISRGSSETEK